MPELRRSILLSYFAELALRSCNGLATVPAHDWLTIGRWVETQIVGHVLQQVSAGREGSDSCWHRGESKNTYVPQSVLTPEGEILDIHIVLNEMFKSGDKLFVEYSAGPVAYKAR